MEQKPFIPFSRPWIDDTEIEAVSEVLASKWISTGARVREFERAFAEYLGVRHAIAVSSCTAALHLSLVVSGIGVGDEVITTPYTFTATAEAIRYVGAKPVFVDIDPETLNIDITKIAPAITSRTKAIMPVHIAGLSCDMDALREICQKHNLVLIDDAAHAIPAEYNGKYIGSLGDLSAFSFYANKNMTTAEGGMITTNNDSLAEPLRTMRLHGIDKDAWARQSGRSIWRYEITTEGYKYNMTDIQAAMGLCQLMKLNKQHERRQNFVQIYQSELAKFPQVSTPFVPDNPAEHAWHLYIIQLHTGNRDDFVESLREANIECSVHYIPLHLFEFYQKQYGYSVGDFPYAEEVFERVISLPLHPGLTESDVHLVIDAIGKILRLR
ncbi:UDP-4-amino-4,6-dideoxy-N-acetyl-beta-L-altrosamine transaminase [Candidatus Poribacteria bacterium]|nr:MAG: UDP-4-amino-4,6-dideoxy-N-acetyl-beta-L-altrosamine transaminase [Candidatus Poribacteria bacterium]